jgi:prepilin-type N-terminal cleavage/methylation domain-containing protein/prepilin-type processing-associated H-X9-DG protein
VPKRSAFTLIELLVVISIIGILIALLLPAVQAARSAAQRAQCLNNMKQLGLALVMYETQHKAFPPGGLDNTNNGNRMGWPALVLPYIEQTALAGKLDYKKSYLDNVNKSAAMTPVAVFLCPSQREQKSVLMREFASNGEQLNGKDPYSIHYYGVAGPKGTNPQGVNYTVQPGGSCGGFALGGVLYRNSRVRYADIRDGSSNTFLLGEISWDGAKMYRIWNRGCDDQGCGWCSSCKNVVNGINVKAYTVFNQDFNDVSFGSEHAGGANFVFSDGSVRFVSEGVNLGVFRATASRSGGEPAVVIE